MSRFMELHLPEYSLNTESTVVKSVNDKFCFSCLRKNVQYIELATCEHAKLLDNLLELKMLQLNDCVICLWCHSTLMKIEKFKLQAIESIKIMKNGISGSPTKNHQTNLELSKIEIQSAIDSQPIEHQIIERAANNESAFEFGTEVKIEQDYFDFEQDTPLEQISKEKVRKPKSVNAKKKVSKTRLQRYDDKVKIVVLSEQEMLEDRKRDATNKGYLNLPYKCDKCITGFNHELNLTEHMDKRHKMVRGSQVCSICESVLNTKLSFDEHHKRHYRRVCKTYKNYLTECPSQRIRSN